jgi:DNA (cytosine-5)-methyltransferase 1
VQVDLETEGYEVQPYVLPAVSVNAPHRRDRVWFVAYAKNYGYNQPNEKQHNSEISNKTEQPCRSNIDGERSFKHTNGIGQKWGVYENKSEIPNGQQLSKSNSWDNKTTYWENFPSQSPLCFGDDGLSSQLDGITFSKWRNESIKAAGNAIVPQVAYQIFKAINAHERSFGCA